MASCCGDGGVRHLIGTGRDLGDVEMCGATDENLVRLWPVGVDGAHGCHSPSWRLRRVQRNLPRDLVPAAVSGAKALIRRIGMMATSLRLLLCWEHCAGRLEVP